LKWVFEGGFELPVLPGCFLDDDRQEPSLLGWWLLGEFLAERAGLLDGLYGVFVGLGGVAEVPDPADPGGPEGPLDPPPHPAPGASEGSEDPDTVDAFPEKEPFDHQERSADDRGNRHFRPDPTIVPLQLAGSPLSSAAVSEPTNAALGAGDLIY
jgi:hypothetical protein